MTYPDETNIPAAVLAEAKRRHKIIAAIALGPVSQRQARQAAEQLGVRPRTVYRYVRAHLKAPFLTTHLPARYRRPKTAPAARLPELTEYALQRVLHERYLPFREERSIRDMAKLVNRFCRRLKTRGIDQRTFRRRAQAVSKKTLAKTSKIKADPHTFKWLPGKLCTDIPGEYAQMDHTLADAFVDMRGCGLGILRLWLTLVVDIATRMVLGYGINIKPPTGRTNVLTILMCCCPKRSIIERAGISLAPFHERGIDDPWPTSFLIQNLGTDNGTDLKFGELPEALVRLGVHPHYRPVGEPHHGGHIERLIGRMMGELHMIKGTSFSNVVAKKGYDPMKEAAYTFEEFETWLVLNILRYHVTPHRALGCSPYQKFKELEANIPPHLVRPDPDAVRHALLEHKSPLVRGQGITVHRRTYQSPRLAPHVGQRVRAGFNRTDMTRVYVSLDFSQTYFEVPLAPWETPTFAHLDATQRDRQRTKAHYHDQKLKDLEEELTGALYELDDQVRTNARQRQRQIARSKPAPKRTPPRLTRQPLPLLSWRHDDDL
ncbi:Mu transposase C-terminal domain-containing protein [Gimibacter soli]|uniref:Mu transposase C-terminal domain-containing protein n=1 Tax=Gimibacter soli TaxID=3024400 RepID=A0AAE9XQ57_9PROT|nr:Mu transposase C-terminal domain-containing protein [Gimibacter soli]WCL52885.1 Mu transposase C-terminal domain-containing protein [Gimibacter soli]